MTDAQQQRIDQINTWVADFKENDNMESAEFLVKQFEPFLLSTSNKLNKMYSGVHAWEHIVQEARVIFYDLLGEYTIGGVAYFNVYIQRKLPLRLRYFFIKEIKRRSKDLSHSEDQMTIEHLIEDYDNVDIAIDDMVVKQMLGDAYFALDQENVVSSREKDMILRNLMGGESHESIADDYKLSRSRVSRIIKNGLRKIREYLYDRKEYV